MSIIPKERALPIIENAFKQQSLVEKLCKLMNSDGNELHADIAGMVKAVFDFDYTEFQSEEYDRYYNAFYDLLENKALSNLEKARSYYDLMHNLIVNHSGSQDKFPGDILDTVILEIVASAIKFEIISRTLEEAFTPFIIGGNPMSFRDNYNGPSTAYFLLGLTRDEIEDNQGLSPSLDACFENHIDSNENALISGKLNPFILAKIIIADMRGIINEVRSRRKVA